jgi:predicted acetyltransferase
VATGQTDRVPLEIRTPTEDDLPAMYALDGRAFGEQWSEADIAAFGPVCELDRFRIATDGADLVGVAGSYGQELTLPGGGLLPAGGVTWVAVATSHRRQGLLRRLLVEIHADIAGRGEPVAQLTASEGGIYERFGYGVATRYRLIEIDRRRTQVAERFRPEGPPIRMVDPGDHVDHMRATFDRYRRGRVGEIARTEAWIRMRLHDFGTGCATALHPDGYATWKVDPQWHDGQPAHEVQLMELIASTPDAHAALWNLVLSIDLAGPIRSRSVLSLDDPLPFLLTDQRALRTTNLNDMLWIKPLDHRRSFGARTYGTDDAFVVEVESDEGSRRWKIGGSPEGADVRPSRSRPHLTTDQASLGALLLGGVAPTTLAAGRRLRASSTDVLRRADRFFTCWPAPHCSTGF